MELEFPIEINLEFQTETTTTKKMELQTDIKMGFQTEIKMNFLTLMGCWRGFVRIQPLLEKFAGLSLKLFRGQGEQKEIPFQKQ